MAWLILFLAGICEIAWAIGLKYGEGFSKPLASVATLSALVISFVLLGIALRTLPLGVAYGIWVGIGAVGTAVMGILLFGEAVSLFKLMSLALIVIGIAGLKLAS
ncbi:QacE family quaternary ammonium compound efflux SMR transporter [Vibrio cholerae]|uniref:DMT family transporter n=1 Tax=Vibrio cholerae TaxID=666 RepID=UPI00096BBB50|nr:SMR family transporter [Vibrio cholerae]EGR0591585.1 QacE family quaternary ammonium compound efflux SMR transporter [Vibrio cholerae]EGR2124862.1 QacE family quaternary ammonium compound efflux SMR transporter [Vibrio cholerae]EJL6835609.1 QacE family quaternary ammonium compound efflux SMR transporter [Vibrio cholerae]EKF9228146.1 QacE family quaternary ammonium compound efflux SMR transporter [Vibrio cholerae]EKF9825847.1 QacE family quaternary ammonium compound efflux SMR transporter [V